MGWRRRLPAILGTAAAVFVGLPIVLLIVVFFTSKLYRIPSATMEPTLHCARPGTGCIANRMDRIVVWKPLYWFSGPGRGDIVAFKTPKLAEQRCGAGGTFVKRLIGLPGERFAERNGYVYINGKQLNEPYIKPDRRDVRTISTLTIPKGGYFMMGDNRIQSCDSREWGAVPRKDIIGKVFLVYWPLSRFGFR